MFDFSNGFERLLSDVINASNYEHLALTAEFLGRCGMGLGGLSPQA